MIATWITQQLVLDGAVAGMLYGLLAMGIVLIYRATRVINFAVGSMGMVGAALFALLVAEWNVPFWLAVPIALLVGVMYGAVLELAVIRRLFDAPRVIVLVATVGIAQLSTLIIVAYPDFTRKTELYPRAITHTFEFAGLRIGGPALTILLVVPLLVVGLGWFLTGTTLGKAIKASASNRDLARLVGISPKLVSTAVWAIGGGLATLTMALISAQTNSRVGALDNLGPSTLARALAAAVLARMMSFPRAFGAAVAIGIAESVVRFNFLDQSGLIDFVLLLVILVAVWFQSRGRPELQSFAFAPRVAPVPERLRNLWWVRQLDRVGLLLLGIVAVVLPLVVTQSSRHLLYALVIVYAIAGLSLTVLTGWAGQLSLAQMSFAGIGAFLAAAFHRGMNWDIQLFGHRISKAGIQPLGIGPSILLAALAVTLVAVLIGAGALRVRGLLLAVVTFAFAHAAVQYLYRRPLFTGNLSSRVPFQRQGETLFGIDVDSQRAIYYVALAVLALVVFVVGRLRRSPVGWSTIAVRDNPDTASAYTVNPISVKLRAFAMSGLLAGLAGALLVTVVEGIPIPVVRYFQLDDSLILLSIVVIGGLGSNVGPILGATWVVGLPAFFPGNEMAPLLTSSVGMLVLLMYFPGGFVQIGYGIRGAILNWLDARMGPAEAKQQQSLPPSLAVERPQRTEPVVVARDMSVRFGGNVAVDKVNLEVRPGEIVGLIGTNGAGKSTLMNAIGGYVPSTGHVELLGTDATHLSAAARARLGLGRTFQAATLFPELTVRQTVQVALEARGRSGLLATAVAWPPTVARQRRHRSAADEIIDFLGLGRYADQYIANLSTGTRRIVELAGLLALQAEVLCLDEPTAGVAQKETEAFGPLIVAIRKELNASMLIIEHDMPLILGISDRVYCLEAGKVIAVGEPDVVRNDPRVIASYLGTDERAIARSGAIIDDETAAQ
jgi:ABC-type branched-subunit amino acid transport system ATPase component/ABC-type branched-subunit amino acid transport system permease subunit